MSVRPTSITYRVLYAQTVTNTRLREWRVDDSSCLEQRRSRVREARIAEVGDGPPFPTPSPQRRRPLIHPTHIWSSVHSCTRTFGHPSISLTRTFGHPSIHPLTPFGPLVHSLVHSPHNHQADAFTRRQTVSSKAPASLCQPMHNTWTGTQHVYTTGKPKVGRVKPVSRHTSLPLSSGDPLPKPSPPLPCSW